MKWFHVGPLLLYVHFFFFIFRVFVASVIQSAGFLCYSSPFNSSSKTLLLFSRISPRSLCVCPPPRGRGGMWCGDEQV